MHRLLLWGILLLACTVNYAQKPDQEWVYIPQKEWKSVVSSETKGVHMTYQEYMNLLEKQPQPQQNIEGVLVKSVQYQGKVTDNTLMMTMTMQLESLSEQLVAYEFEFGTWGIAKATLNNSDIAVFVRDEHVDVANDNIPQQQLANSYMPHFQTRRMYKFFVANKGSYSFTMVCYKNMTLHKDTRSTTIELGKFPSQVVTIETQPENFYNTNPQHRVSENSLEIYLGSNNRIDLTISPKEKKDEKQALEIVQTIASHFIQVDSVTSHFQIELDVYHKPLKTFEFILPKNTEIINISESRWDLSTQGNSQKLVIQLEKELLGQHLITIDCEKQVLEDGQFSLPTIQATGQYLLRQGGIVYLEKHSDIKVELHKTFLTQQIDLQEVYQKYVPSKYNYKYNRKKAQESLQIRRFGHTPLFAVRFWDGNYSLEIAKTKIESKIESSYISALSIYPDGFELSSHITFDVIEGERKLLAIAIPQGWTLTSLDMKFAHSQRHRFQNYFSSEYYVKDSVLYLPLQNTITKGQRVKVSISLQNMPENWQGEWQQQQHPIPVIVPQDAEFLPSFMGIIADINYQVHDRNLSDFSSVDPQIISSLQVASDNLVLGYKITSPQAKGRLVIDNKHPQISVVAAHYIDVDAKRVRYATVLAYEIKNAAVKKFEFTTPSNLAFHISDESNLIKEKQQQVEKDTVKWQIHLQKKVIGTYSLYLTAEVPIQKSYDTYRYPNVSFSGLKLSHGYFGIQASSRSEVTVVEDNLEAISPKKIPIFAHPEFTLTEDFVYALKYDTTRYNLDLTIGTHETVEVADAVLKSVTIRSIYPGNDIERVECEYFLSHLRSQFFEIELPENSSFWSAVVDNEGAKPNNIGNKIAIPIKRHNDGSDNHIKILYERKVDTLKKFGKLQLARPKTDKEIPVRVLHWQVYLPQEYRIARGFEDVLASKKPWYHLMGRAIGKMLRSVSYSPKTSRSDDRGRYYENAPAETPAPQKTAPVQNAQKQIEKYRELAQKKQEYDQRRRAEEERRRYKSEESKRRLELEKQVKERIQRNSRYNKDKIKKENKNTLGRSDAYRPGSAAKPDMDSADDSYLNEKTEEWTTEELAEPETTTEALAPEDMEDSDDFGDDLGGNYGNVPAEDGLFGPGKGGGMGGKDNAPGADNNQLIPGSNESTIEDPSSGYDMSQPEVKKPQSFVDLGKKYTQSGIETIKAKGLRSINIDLNKNDSVSAGKATPVSQDSITLGYVHSDTARSIEFILIGAFALIGVFLIAQHRLPRVYTFMTLILLATFIPNWVGAWLIPYSNAIVWGLLLSVFLGMLYTMMNKIHGWFGMRQVAVFILCLGLFAQANSLQAQEKRRVYVPYDPEKITNFQNVEEVFLPYDTYVQLWNNAYPDNPIEKVEQKLLPEYVLYNAQYRGKSEQDKVEFTANLMLEVFQAPAQVSIGLANTSVQSAYLQAKDGNESVIPVQPVAAGYKIVVERPGTYQLRVKFLPKFELATKRGQFKFNIVPIATSVLQFELEKDIEVDLPNFVGGWHEKLDNNNKTVVLYPSMQETVEMQWFESSERHRAKGLNVSVNSENTLLIENNVLHLSSNLNYNIASGEIDRLALRVPKDFSIISLECTNLEQWTLSQEQNSNLLTLRLVDSSKRDLSVVLKAEQEMRGDTYRFPEVIPIEASRENGRAIIVYKDSYQMLVTKQDNVRKIKSSSQSGQFTEVFRFNEHPYVLDFSVQERVYKNFTRSDLDIAVTEEKLLVSCKRRLEVKGKRLFYHRLHLPKDLNITKVTGNEVATWRTEEASDNRQLLEIAFKRGILKDQAVDMEIVMEKEFEPGQSFSIPALAAEDVEYESGNILLSSPKELDLTSDEVKSLQEYDVSVCTAVNTSLMKRYAYRFDGIDYQAKISTRLKDSKISAKVAIGLLVEDDKLSFGYFVHYQIEFAGVDTFSFLLPNSIGEGIEIAGDNIREKKSRKTQDGKFIEWSVMLHNKVRGSYTLSLFPEIMKNTGTGITFHPIFFPKDVNNQVIVLIENNSDYEITAQQVSGLTSIDPQQRDLFHNNIFNKLGSQNFFDNVFIAYKADRKDWELTFSENKQKIIHSVHAAVDSIKVDTIIDTSGECRHRAIYNIRHSGLQFLELEKLPDIKIWSAFVGKRFVRPVKREGQEGKERILIPLYQASSKEQLLSVRLIYSQQLSELGPNVAYEFHLPPLLNIKEIREVCWALHVPQGYIYKFGGNVSPSTINFSEYNTSFSGDINAAISQELNAYNLKSALSNSNSLKQRLDVWLEKKEESQKRLFANLQDIRQQDNERQNSLNLEQVQQYGMRNLRDAQRAGQGNFQEHVYQDKRAKGTAGKSMKDFISVQNEKAQQKMITQNRILQEQRQVPFFFDIHIPDNYQYITFSKKQGNATLEVRTYRDPKQSKFWITIQFAGLLLLIVLAARWDIFNFRAYSLQKMILTVFIAGAAVFFFNFLGIIHNFYL